MADFDFIIIGGGHNALICGTYLAKSGQRTLVLERRSRLGGGSISEEVTVPGFLHNLHSAFHRYVPDLPWYKDLDLGRFGVRYYQAEVQNMLPISDGRCLIIHRDYQTSVKKIARVSERDAKVYADLYPRWRKMAERYLFPEMYSPPMKEDEKFALWEKTEEGRELVRLSRMAAINVVTETFEDPHLRALVLYYVAVKGWDWEDPGLGFQVVMSTVGAERAGVCIGGSGQLTHGLQTALAAHGGLALTGRPATEVLVDGGRAVGVRTADGETYKASKGVVSALTPQQTFLELLDGGNFLQPKTLEGVKGFKYSQWRLFGGHLALNEPPEYKAAEFDPDVQRAVNLCIGYETLEDFKAHLKALGTGKPPEKPGMQCGVFTLFDPSQAPAGKHTALLWQAAPYDLADGGPALWEEIKGDYLEACIARWRHYAPNLDEKNILGKATYTPYDIARSVVNMAEGDFNAGAMIRKQVLENRPVPELSGYKTPVESLYLTGSSTHPGGLLTGAPGYNTARVIHENSGLKVWWNPP
ncbi:MAG: phytoene desaturase family protein, partial [Nitrospinota bacterium]